LHALIRMKTIFTTVLYYVSIIGLVGCGFVAKKAAAQSLPVSLALAPSSSSVTPSQTVQFSVIVQNDTQNLGVAWSLSQSGIPCSPSCGTLIAFTKLTAIYAAPISAPNLPAVTLTASSIADSTKSASATISVVLTAPANVSQQSDQWVDITKYGARSVGLAPTATASCIAGSNRINLSNHGWPQDFTQFQNGDSIRLDNCGLPTAMTPPTGLTVSPGMNAGGTPAVSVPSMGTTSYSYQVIACDKFGGCSAASHVASTWSGTANLGNVTAKITRMSLSNNRMTVTTASHHGFQKNALIFIQYFSTRTPSFEGSYIISSVPSPTTFTFLTSIDSRIGGTPTLDTSGGNALAFNCNVLTWKAVDKAWKYFIYGRNAGAEELLGVAEPGVTTWQDYGATIMGSFSFPSFVPTTPPANPSNQYLLTTISAGAGNSTIQIASPASNTVASVLARMGSDAAILSAFNAAAYGTLFIPEGTFQVAGYLDLHALGPIYVMMGGNLQVTDTMQVPGGLHWSAWGPGAPTQFQESPTPYITGLAGSYPTVYLGDGTGGQLQFDHIGFTSSSPNGTLLFYADSGEAFNFTYVAFSAAGGPGPMNRHFILRTGGFDNNFSNCLFLGPQPTLAISDIGTVFLPTGLFAPAGAIPTGGIKITDAWFVGKASIEANASNPYSNGGVSGAEFDDIRTQNGLLPIFVASNYPNQNTISNSAASFNGYSPADYPTPMTGNWAANTMSVSLQNLSNVPAGSRPLVVGNPTVFSGQSGGTAGSATGGGWFATGGSQVGYLIPPPASPPTLTVSSGGDVATGTHNYQVAWTDAFGNSTTLGPPATVNVVSGMQTVLVTPPSAPSGAVGWQYYRDGALHGPSSIVCGPFGIGTSQTDTLPFSACGNSAPSQNTAMSSGQGINGEETTQITLTGGGHEAVISGTFSANRNLTVQDASGSITLTIAHGTVTMPTDAIAAGTCGISVQATASGVLPIDVVTLSSNVAPSSTNPLNLKLKAWAIANSAYFQYCNGTDSDIKPLQESFNWQVTR
jgi:hypothetical protein